MKVMCVLGTRPEAIKMAPVVMELRRRSGVETIVCSTGQHRQMLDQVLNLFGIEPDFDLNVMSEAQTPSKVASMVLERIEPVLRDVRPDWVLVQGDTTTAAAAALAAFYNRSKVGHVEAGLRTRDKWQPFPEEINRRIVGVIADLHFAPTQRARENLLSETVPPDRILVTGNTVIDALLWVAGKPPSEEARKLIESLELSEGTRLVLVTAHRRENHGEPLRRICEALRMIAERYGDSVRIVYPVHLNPNVWGPVHEMLEGIPNVKLLPPLDYEPMVRLMQRAYLILTDSGGLQEEAPALGVPVLVLRNTTERPEGIAAGTAKLVGTDVDRITSEAFRLLDDPEERGRMARAINPYGDGKASKRIVEALLS
ncbi:UDP-N-acetylglucosamine 2-epimerase (non-hydrolyzing) [Candidatus Poribacteria bacterium]|nr:MAG: UDP-N-acetylglucosamine 2-epimerase (non-hydrolyzing) [Candidatus Poribacteria bacterium]